MFVAEITLKIHENIDNYISRKYSPKIFLMIIHYLRISFGLESFGLLLWTFWDSVQFLIPKILFICSSSTVCWLTASLWIHYQTYPWIFLYPMTLERYQKSQNYSFSLVEWKYLYFVRPKTLQILKNIWSCMSANCVGTLELKRTLNSSVGSDHSQNLKGKNYFV